MADKKLESFKIGDRQKAQVKKTAAKGRSKGVEAPPPEAQTFGFARIEAILDNEPFDDITRNLAARREALKEFEQTAKGPKDKTAAKKAALAVDRTADLLAYLFRTKASMLESEARSRAESRPSKAAKGEKGQARR